MEDMMKQTRGMWVCREFSRLTHLASRNCHHPGWGGRRNRSEEGPGGEEEGSQRATSHRTVGIGTKRTMVFST